MSYVQITSSCFSDVLGAHGLDRGRFNAILENAKPALESLRAQHADGSLPLLGLPGRTDDLAALELVAERYRDQFDDVVILGTGGVESWRSNLVPVGRFWLWTSRWCAKSSLF